MKERIEAIIQHEHLSPSQFADAIGVQRSGISHILSGRNKPSVDFLNKLLSKFPHISGDWLITGIGNMLNGSEAPSKSPQQLELVTSEPKSRKPLKVPSKSLDGVPNQSYGIPKQTEDAPTPIVSDNKDKNIERIVVFYTDKTFSEYKPE